MKRISTVLAVLLLVAAGCGQSGPLYIPGNPSKIEQPPPAPDTSADEDADENGDTDGNKNQ